MEQEQKQQQQFLCSGDCTKCHQGQRLYCAAHWSYDSLCIIESMQKALDAMNGTIKELSAKVAAIQDGEASLFVPSRGGCGEYAAHETDEDEDEDTAQEEDGAENRSS